MIKSSFCITFLYFITLNAHAQAPSADAVYNQYLNFNLARFQGEQDSIRILGEAIIPYADKLPEKMRINFYFGAGKMYEDDSQPDKALPFYEKVAAAVPDYYVVHRALGYLYLDKAKSIEDRMNVANNKTGSDTLFVEYVAAVKKALPHLEKAQACDPSDETLNIIKTLYGKINDAAGINTLNSRLKQMSTDCVDVLSDN